jgi:hypothetical protein
MPVRDKEIIDIALNLSESVWVASSREARRRILALANVDDQFASEDNPIKIYAACEGNEKGFRMLSSILSAIGSTLALVSSKSCENSSLLLAACVNLGIPYSTLDEVLIHIQQRSVLALCDDLGISEKNTHG